MYKPWAMVREHQEFAGVEKLQAGCCMLVLNHDVGS